MPTGPVVLVVLDGFGMRADAPDNAVTTAPAQTFDKLWKRWPHTTLKAHGEAVGLIAGQMGDSNVGHLNLGAGRVVYQNLARVYRAMDDGTLAASPVLAGAFSAAAGSRLHFLGLLSPGGVHSHQEHLFYLLKLARAAGVEDIALHLALDGRDVPPKSALTYLRDLANAMGELGGNIRVATIMGRYYAMDRDNRWDRTERAYRAMVEGIGPRARSAPEAVAASYHEDVTDEFVLPTVLVDEQGAPQGLMRIDDSVFLFNFRADRVRQMLHALADPDFHAFPRPMARVGAVAGLALYDENFPVPHVLTPPSVPDNLAEWLSRRGLRQLHVAETEKYAHVTFFFNGGVEKAYPGEDRKLVESPKVATYDKTPAMAADGITDEVLGALDADRYDFILVNYANADMVGHTGVLEASQAAVRAVDAAIGRVADKVLEKGGLLAITADHGNAEHMTDSDGGPDTNHTDAPVPLILVGQAASGVKLREGGGLSDVAPTLLRMMGIAVPDAMTGESLVRENLDGKASGQEDR